MIRENWNLNGYQMKARKYAIYPERMKITYPALGLAGEAGEVADKVKKIYRDRRDDARFKGDIAKEIGDVHKKSFAESSKAMHARCKALVALLTEMACLAFNFLLIFCSKISTAGP